jgi:hypothetical protein
MHMLNRRSSGSHGSSDMGADARSIGHSAGRIHGSSVLLEAGANLGHRPRVESIGDAQCAKASNSRSEEGCARAGHGSGDMRADGRNIGHSAGCIHGSSLLLKAGANLGHRPRVGSVGDAQGAKAGDSRSEEGMCHPTRAEWRPL